MNLFQIDEWRDYWATHPRERKEEFQVQFGLRQAHGDKHKKIQFDNDIS